MFRKLVFYGTLFLTSAALAQALPPAMTEDYSAMVGDTISSDIGLVRNGNTANNRLGGTNLRDAFFGAGGNDVLVGYDDFDTYTFQPGDGLDVIVDQSPSGNKIKFREVPENAVAISEVSGFDGEMDRLITYGGNSAIRIVGWSRLSDETKSAWTFEYFFLPRPEPTPIRPSPTGSLLSNPTSILLVILLLGVGIFPLAHALFKRR